MTQEPETDKEVSKKEMLKKLTRVFTALRYFAEEPTAQMDWYSCHAGITTKEKCDRCSKAIEAWQALAALEEVGK